MGKTFWKDIYRSITTSKGRFSSILLLMMLGSFAFIGLKVSAPNMQRTAQNTKIIFMLWILPFSILGDLTNMIKLF